MTEDLSLGLILDDRDDSVFAGGWSDEDEELDGEFVCTPRLVYFFSPKISYLRYLKSSKGSATLFSNFSLFGETIY